MIAAPACARGWCVSTQRLPKHFAGAEFDEEFLTALPAASIRRRVWEFTLFLLCGTDV